jgi:hypothetical protein
LDYLDVILYAEQTGAQTVVTNFRGPQYIKGASCWHVSNDHQDSFFSFAAYDASTGQRILYRYNGPLAAVFAPGFTPFVSNDPRLTALTLVPDTNSVAGWDGTGTKYLYDTASGANPSNYLVYGFDTVTGTTTLINDPAVSGINFHVSRCSSTELRLFGNATDLRRGTTGIASFYPATMMFTWVIQEGGKNSSNISSFTAPLVSPDGTVVAFGMLRVVSGKTCPSLVRVPVSGGAYTPLVTFPASTTNTINAGSQAWTW